MLMRLAFVQAGLIPGFFAPADRRRRRRSGSASGSEGVRAASAARAARRAALKPYRKFSHGPARQPGKHVLGQIRQESGGTRHLLGNLPGRLGGTLGGIRGI